jgi:hypothetical protein
MLILKVVRTAIVVECQYGREQVARRNFADGVTDYKLLTRYYGIEEVKRG